MGVLYIALALKGITWWWGILQAIGIAYDVAKDRLFVTGKLWPKVFEIRITKGR